MIRKLWIKFLTWFGDLYFATEPPKIKASHIRLLQDNVQPGDIILRRYTYYLDSYFIKGKYTHSGLLINETEAVHAVAEGICKIDIIDFVKDADGFILCRPAYPNFIAQRAAIDFVSCRVGLPYDFFFGRGNDAFYCHELTISALSCALSFDLDRHKIFLADDVMAHCMKVLEV